MASGGISSSESLSYSSSNWSLVFRCQDVRFGPQGDAFGRYPLVTVEGATPLPLKGLRSPAEGGAGDAFREALGWWIAGVDCDFFDLERPFEVGAERWSIVWEERLECAV